MARNVNADHGPQIIGISEITFKSEKSFKSIKVKILDKNSIVHRDSKAFELDSLTFQVPPGISISSQHVIRVTYPQFFWTKTFEIRGKELLSSYRRDEPEGQIWKGSYDKLKVIIGLVNRSQEPPGSQVALTDSNDPLAPTTNKILEICPQFRILVMGKSGGGKSSLINKAFGVTDAHVSHSHPGMADIDREIISKKNPRFLVHDSKGFEHGETDTLQIVQNFIRRREEMKEIKLKLHAIWLCIEIPTARGRVVETGVEEFLKLGVSGELGQVPIIVVFTKYDRLVNMEKMAMSEAGQEVVTKLAYEKANETLQNECIVPVAKLAGRIIPSMVISTRPQYSKTLADLIQVTFDNVRKYIMEAGLVTGISQKVNPNVKIRTSIEIGKKLHWRGLSNTTLPKANLQDFLGVIHTDIVKVWDLDDKHEFLLSLEFRTLMLGSVEHGIERRISNRILIGTRPILEAVTGIVSALSAPATPIVVPIGDSILSAEWVQEAYHKTQTNLRRIMTYILDLTLVMQNLFWIQSILATQPLQNRNSLSERVGVPITRRLIKLAYQIYFTADDRSTLLDQIEDYVKKVTFDLPGGPDGTVEKIIELIDASTISDEDAFKQHSRTLPLDSSWEYHEDEAWDLSIITP